jgi:hypothetical protein
VRERLVGRRLILGLVEHVSVILGSIEAAILGMVEAPGDILNVVDDAGAMLGRSPAASDIVRTVDEASATPCFAADAGAILGLVEEAQNGRECMIV